MAVRDKKDKIKASPSAAAKAIAAFDAKFIKTYGTGSIVSDEAEIPYEVIPTGSITLDYYTGVGGYVRGRLTEVWGQDDIGKSFFLLQAAREAQRVAPEQLVAWINTEKKWDWPWARVQGVDTSTRRFRLIEPQNAEDVADAMKDAIRSGLFSLIVLDSIGAMIPEAEKEKDADEVVMAAQAKIITRMVKIAAVEAQRTKTAVVMINQVRANISAYGKDTQAAGPFALKHCSTLKIEMKGTATKLRVGSEGKQLQVGHEVAMFLERNKVAQAKRTAFVTFVTATTDRYGPIGIDRADEATTMGIKTGVIAQNAGWYTNTLTGEKFNGRDTVVESLRNDQEGVDALREAIVATMAGQVVAPEESAIEVPEDEDEVEAEAEDVVAEGTAEAGAEVGEVGVAEMKGTGLFRTGAAAASGRSE